MFNWIFSDTYQYLKPYNFYLYLTELLQIEQFDHLSVCIYKMSLQIIYLIWM